MPWLSRWYVVSQSKYAAPNVFNCYTYNTEESAVRRNRQVKMVVSKEMYETSCTNIMRETAAPRWGMLNSTTPTLTKTGGLEAEHKEQAAE